MASNSVRGQKISSVEWAKAKPEIARMYLDQDLTLKEVIEEMKRQGFSATEGQYRSKLNSWGPKWKKNEKSENRDALAIELIRRKDEDLDVYQWGELISKERISNIIRRSRPPTHQLFRNPTLPKGVSIRTRRHDLTQKLTSGLPFHGLEDYLYRQALSRGSIDPGLLNTLDITRVTELRDVLGHQQGFQTHLHENLNSSILVRLRNNHPALNSILPHSDISSSMDGSSISNTRSGIFISPIHRQVLCSLGNNLAGLEDLPLEQLLQLLKEVSSPEVFSLIMLSAPSYYATSIAQQILKGAIEVGNARVVEAILCHQPLQIDINEQICDLGGERYTALERASMLQFAEVIEVMLRHGADVHKSYADFHKSYAHAAHFSTECKDHEHPQVIDHALMGPYVNRLDPKIFRMIIEKSRYICYYTMEILAKEKEDESVLFVVLRQPATCLTQWPKSTWYRMITSLTQETSMQLVNKMSELGLAAETGMLNAALRGGHEELVRMLLESGLTLDGYSLEGAIESGNETIVRILFENGAKIHNELSCYKDPYSTAIRTQNSRIMDLLVEKGALEHLRQWDAWFAAWLAAVEVGDLKLIEELMDMHKDIPNYCLRLALTKVSEAGNYRLAVKLLDLGADFRITTRLGTWNTELGTWNRESQFEEHHPLAGALKVRNQALVKLFLDSGADPHADHPHHGYTIKLAVEWGNHQVVEALLEAGVTEQLYPAMVMAVERKDQVLVDMLLNAGADLGYEPLQAAMKAGDHVTSSWLLERGADPHNPIALENAFLSHSPFLETLLQAHKRRYPMGKKGFVSRALCKAVKEGNESMVKRLLIHESNPNDLLNHRPRPMLDLIAKNSPFFSAITFDGGRNTIFAKLFMHYGRSQDNLGFTPDCVVAEMESPQMGNSSPRITALLAAIGTNSRSMVQFLLQEGASINFPAVGGIKRTPLQRAAEIGNFDMVQLCYKYGADVNAPPCRIGGATALQLAAIGGFSAIVIYLLSCGADVHAPGALVHGMTALEGAAANGRPDTVSILLAKAGNEGNDLPQFQRAIALADKNGHISVSHMLRAHLRL